MTSAWESIKNAGARTPYLGLYGNACPKCLASAQVIDSRPIKSTTGAIRRRRECECGERFSTIEIREDDLQELILAKQYLSTLTVQLDAVEQLNQAMKDLI